MEHFNEHLVDSQFYKREETDLTQLRTTIEQQQKRIEELEAKMADDWCGCVGIHNHRLGVCTTCNKPVIGWWEVAKSAIEDLAAAQAQIKALREALENCRLLAARHRKEEWATHILRFCESGGSVANPLRQDDSALRETLKQERERCAVLCEEIDVAAFGSDRPAPNDCANAIRAMEDEPEKTPKLICPRCGVDRFKVPCPGPFHLCPIHGEAQSMEDK